MAGPGAVCTVLETGFVAVHSPRPMLIGASGTSPMASPAKEASDGLGEFGLETIEMIVHGNGQLRTGKSTPGTYRRDDLHGQTLSL